MMKTLLKLFGGLIALVLIVMIGTAIYARYFFDANSLRGSITELVEQRTGRTLTIEGDLELSIFPWVRVDIGRTTLGDDPEFGQAPMLVFDNASASVKFRPLLSRQLELGTTTVEGAVVGLISLKDGRNNWQEFVGKLQQADPAEAAEQVEEAAQFSTNSMGAIELKNAAINFIDRSADQDRQELSFTELNLTTGELKPDTPFTVNVSTQMSAADVALSVAFEGELTLGDEIVGIEKPQFEVSGNHYAVPFDEFNVALKGAAAEVGAERASLDGSVVTWTLDQGEADAQTVTSLSGTMQSDTLLWNGTSIDVQAPVVNMDTQLKPGEGGVTQALVEFSSTVLKWDGNALALEAPALEVKSKLSGAAADAMNAQFNAASINGELRRLQVAGATLKGSASGADVPDGSQVFDLASALLTIDAEQGDIIKSAYTANMLGLNLSGEIEASKLYESPRLNGPVIIAPFNAREFMAQLGEPLITTDPQVLSRVGVSSVIAYNESGMVLNDLKLALDGSNIHGKVALTENGQTVDLVIDQIDADRYLAPPDDADEARAVDVIEVPADQIRALNVNGRLRIGALKFSGIDSTDVDITLSSGAGKVRVHPAKATLYGGNYSGDIRVDATGEVPQIAMNERFTNVDFGAFMASISPTPDEPQQLTGRITGAMTITASGHNTRDLKATSSGSTEFSITDGVLNGINVMESVRNIVAVANKEATVPDEPDRTEFRELSGSAQISDGVLSNNDLAVVMPLMRVSGAGTLDLNTTAIDYRVGANVVQEGDVPLEKELRFISDYTLPLYISGTMAAPVVDKNRSIQDVVKQYAKKRVKDALLDRLGLGEKDEGGEVPTASSGDTPTLADPSADPTGEAPAELEPEPELTPEEQLEQKKEELKDELDDKVKDKLKDLFGG